MALLDEQSHGAGLGAIGKCTRILTAPYYKTLRTVPGMGPKTAAVLATLVDASMLRGHDELVAYADLAPCNRQSETSLTSSSPSQGGNRTLKNLLICA